MGLQDSAGPIARRQVGPGRNVAVLRLRNITFMSPDPERLADFWAAALGFDERQATDDEILLADAEWSWPRCTIQRVDAARARPAPLHLDLTPLDDRGAAVARLVALGATEGETHGDEGGFRWTVVLDPDGNEFCVTDP
jgi:catechol 2,3-dioxygenase-like lactoylglutathione lyase family enzyme